MREPCIFWSPAKIKPAVVYNLGSTMDLFTTFSTLAGVPIPDDRVIYGVNISGTLFRNEQVRGMEFFITTDHSCMLHGLAIIKRCSLYGNALAL